MRSMGFDSLVNLKKSSVFFHFSLIQPVPLLVKVGLDWLELGNFDTIQPCGEGGERNVVALGCVSHMTFLNAKTLSSHARLSLSSLPPFSSLTRAPRNCLKLARQLFEVILNSSETLRYMSPPLYWVSLHGRLTRAVSLTPLGPPGDSLHDAFR